MTDEWKKICTGAAMVILLSCTSPSQVISAISDKGALDSYPYLDLSTADKAHFAQTQVKQDLERARRYDKSTFPPLFNESEPTRSGEMHVYTGNTLGADTDPLHLKEATQIVVGTVATSEPHLTEGNGFIYSTFSFIASSSLKGNLAGPLLLERAGGVVLFPTRGKRFIGVERQGLPVPGARYLLFLKLSPGRNSFEILGGYSLNGDHVVSLDREKRSTKPMTSDELLRQVAADLEKQ